MRNEARNNVVVMENGILNKFVCLCFGVVVYKIFYFLDVYAFFFTDVVEDVIYVVLYKF